MHGGAAERYRKKSLRVVVNPIWNTSGRKGAREQGFLLLSSVSVTAAERGHKRVIAQP